MSQGISVRRLRLRATAEPAAPRGAAHSYGWVTREQPYALRTPAAQAGYRIAKRSLDVAASLVLLVLMIPVIVAVALAVWTTNPGPILYRHRRLGLDGKQFWCWKFRTMIVNADEVLRRNPELMREFELEFKLQKDPRVTPVGDLLRRSSLDEVPQLFNVLTGEMSLIGPRPVVPPELGRYGEHGEKLLSVVPGLSGLWQACGRSDTTYEERVAMDVTYVDHRSWSVDLKLVLCTVVAVVRGRGAC